ncbi:hypothetical protein BGW80DRAFT_890724 [Lactifluus volemus]|nr:hypothetical protein BGW80DRAFT_890724 [Lactifluus volemus]
MTPLLCPSLLIGRSLFPSIHPTCRRNRLQVCSSSFSFTRNYSSSNAGSSKLDLSLASVVVLGIVVAGGCYSWYRSNLDSDAVPSQDSSSTRDNARKLRQQHVHDDSDDRTGSVHMHYPHHAYMKTSEKTVFPGDHTGVARFDMAHSHSTSNRTSQQFAASVLPVPSGYWSIFALLSAEDPRRRSVANRPASDHEVLSWMRRNIVPAVAGALADVHHANRPPPDAQIDNALRQALTQLYIDVRTPPWISTSTRDARRPASTLLAFYDSESRILRIANTSSAGRAFLGRRCVGNHGYECRELTRTISVSGGMHLDPVQSSPGQARMNIDEAFEEFPSRGLTIRDSAAPVVEVQSVEVHDGDFLVLGSDITWACLAGDEVVQAVGMWIREQEGTMPMVPEKSLLDVPWQKEHDFVLDTMVPRMVRDINEMFVGLQGNAASRVLRQMELGRHRGKKGSDQQDRSVLVRSDDSCSAHSDGGSVMVVVFADGQPRSSK